MITYEDILAANKGLSSIDVKGKDYIQVAERVKAFRRLFPSGFLTTKILSYENGVVVMEAEAGFFDGERRVVLANGLAYEKESSSFLNKTSLIENAQTSAVGRALGFLALGIDAGGICSAEELANALNNQQSKPKRNNPQAETVLAPEPKAQSKMIDLSEIRMRLDEAIKTKTKDMTRNEKIQFLNTVVSPALDGQRNWKLCEEPRLLQKLLNAVS